MSRVVFVGDLYFADLYPSQGLPPGTPGAPTHPIWNPPPGQPSHPIYQPGQPSHPIYHPGHPSHGLPAHPDQGLPSGGGGGSPSQPIYHPGHPSHGLPAHPDQGLPSGGGGGSPSQPIYHPGHPDHGLPAYPDQGLPPGGEDITIDNELPPVPPEYADKVVVAIKRPDQDWVAKAYDADTFPDNALPPAPEPK